MSQDQAGKIRKVYDRAVQMTRVKMNESDKPAPNVKTWNVRTWLEEQAKAAHFEGMPVYLLAHAEDGVIWGRVITESGTLVTSHDALKAAGMGTDVSPPLRALTLQQARLFGERAELLLWRDGNGGWCARLIDDAPDSKADGHAVCAML